MFRKMNDFDGDGKSDFAVTRNEGNSKIWYVWQSRDGFKGFNWGVNGDMLAPGDYDGDGKTDFAIFRPEQLPPAIPRYWIWNSGSNTVSQAGFADGYRIRTTMQDDYNGDGKTDPAVWIGNVQEPPNSGHTNVYIAYSGTGGGTQYGLPGYTFPLRVGDMTGDGRAERGQSDSSGVTITNTASGTSNVISPGISGQIVRGDFDGDGKGDLTIWRESDGMWWWLRSSDNTAQMFQWGMSGDKPVQGDYDGDGKTDPAIWRPGSGQSYFWVYGSQTSSIIVVPWGLSNDTVVQP
jgi:hypothetical protein